MVVLSARTALFLKVKGLSMQTLVNATSSSKWWVILSVIKSTLIHFLSPPKTIFRQLKAAMDEGETEDEDEEYEDYISDSNSSLGN